NYLLHLEELGVIDISNYDMIEFTYIPGNQLEKNIVNLDVESFIDGLPTRASNKELLTKLLG
ncbi:MAG: hypothetical protein AAF598_18880, partial [Bacteroidota bacterium]